MLPPANRKKRSTADGSPPTNYGLTFPIEILSNIFTCLLYNDRFTLTVCCRVSKSFSFIASPILYRRIGISPHPSRDSRLDLSLNRLTATGKERPHTRKKKLLKIATHVRIDAHHPLDLCQNTKRNTFPNLKVLTFCMTVNSSGPILHTDPYSTKQCSLGINLKPTKKLVIDGCNLTSIIGFPNGLPPRIYDEISELTMICPSIDYLPEPLIGGYINWSTTKIRKVNWIFYTIDSKTTWKLGNEKLNLSIGNKQINDGKFQTEYWSFSNFLLTFPLNIELNIINSESIDPFTLDLPHIADKEYIQNLFATKVRNRMVFESTLKLDLEYKQKGQTIGNRSNDQRYQIEALKAKDRWQSINWIGMKEYLENNDWEGELEPNEVKAWLGE